MKGIVITTPEFAAMAAEAVARIERFAGLPAELRCVETKEEAHAAKFSLTGSVWVVDADLWLVRAVALPVVQPDLIYATPVVPSEAGWKFIRERAAVASVDPHCWFSGGFFGADFDSVTLQAAMREAREYAGSWAITDRDEEPLNVGIQRAGVPVALLPSGLNWHPRCGCRGYGYEPKGGPVGIHAGGIPAADKLAFLRTYCPD
jgi:hypothetical protein